MKAQAKGLAKELGAAAWGFKIFETSGSIPGQRTAYDLLGPAATLMVVGYTPAKLELRLSNLMAFDASALGVWGSTPRALTEAVELVASGKVALGPFVEMRPMKDVNEVLHLAHDGKLGRRVVLLPDTKENRLMSTELKSHELVPEAKLTHIKYEERPLLDGKGNTVEGLHNVWIWLNNPQELNSYTTEALRELVVAFRRASCDRAAVSVVFTGMGDRAFCTGGNTREYSEYYAGRPTEYRQYMRIFNDAVTAILYCDKPTICRVNGMRVAGGQELGMACDFTVSSDLAVFGQAGPRHGSAPEGGATDFLPLFVGIERAIESCALCEMWSAHKAYRYGLIQDVLPVLKVDGKFIANPKVVTDRMVDEYGKPCHGDLKTGDDARCGRHAAQERHHRLHAARSGGGEDLLPLREPDARLHLEDAGVDAQAQARALGQQQGDQPGLAGAQHAPRGQGRLPRVREGPQGQPGDRLPGAAPGRRARRLLERRAHRRAAAQGRGQEVSSPLTAEVKDAALVITLNRPKANIVDREMMAALKAALKDVANPAVKAVILQAAGSHFSFGASVEEHTPESAPKMLSDFHALLKELLRLPVPMLAAVRGQCLGGAMELVLAASYVAVHPAAKLGQPEIKLASFAPVASVLLPLRIGQGRAEHMLLSGAAIDAPTALQFGLVDVVVGDPEAAAQAFVAEHLAPAEPGGRRVRAQGRAHRAAAALRGGHRSPGEALRRRAAQDPRRQGGHRGLHAEARAEVGRALRAIDQPWQASSAPRGLCADAEGMFDGLRAIRPRLRRLRVRRHARWVDLRALPRSRK